MAIKGNKVEAREGQAFSKKVGVFSAKVVAINPDAADLSELNGMPEELAEKFANYSAERDGDDISKVVVWMKATDEDGEEVILSHTINLIDKDRVSNAGSNQKINSMGNTSYPNKSTGALPDWFNAKGGVRNAKVGEAELYNFLQSWQSNFDFKGGDEFQVDFKKLMKGNVKELRSLMGSDYETNVTGMAIVNIKESTNDEGETTTKSYQATWREFLPGWAYETFKTKGRNANKTLSTYFDNITGEYGVKGKYHIGLMQDFNETAPTEAVNSSPAVANTDASDDY